NMRGKIWHIAVLLLLIQGGQQIFAQGNLLVAPIRVVFENGKQREDLNLSNIGQDTAVYLISFLHYKMLEDGSFKQLGDTDALPTPRADTYLRIFPRRVTLPPGESQIVRLQFRKPADMKDGEYRSHLYFRADKSATPLGMTTGRQDSTKLSVSITPIFGISIPVIIRSGNLDCGITLSDLSLKMVNDSTYNLQMSINRSGKKSAYGSLEATFVPDQGKEAVVGLANGVGVYTELSKRVYNLPLRMHYGAKLKNGKLVLRYLMPRDDGGKELARIEYRIP
ncbi:MAG: hypothetical protein Q8914_12495, partial [Bacteroidota bacterium]|nr:hypothetical protein [Bacteroidota bacterium]